MRYGIITVALVLIISAASADISVQRLAVTYDLSGAGLARETLAYTIMNGYAYPVMNVSLRIPSHATGLAVTDGTGPLQYTARGSDGVIIISFPKGLAPNETMTVTVEFLLKGLVERFNTTHLFTGRLALPRQLSKLSVRLLLPEGYILPVKLTAEDSSQFIMLPTALVSTDGRRLILEWERRDLVGGSFDMFVRFQEPEHIERIVEVPVPTQATSGTDATGPTTGQSFPTLALGVVIGLFIGLALGPFTAVRKGKGEYPKADLKWDEREVVDALLESEGEANQNVLAARVRFSKAKLSKLLTQMEARGLISKESRGKVNRITLVPKDA